MKEKRKKNKQLITDLITEPKPRLVKLPAITKGEKAYIEALRKVATDNINEVEATRKKLRDEVHSKRSD